MNRQITANKLIGRMSLTTLVAFLGDLSEFSNTTYSDTEEIMWAVTNELLCNAGDEATRDMLIDAGLFKVPTVLRAVNEWIAEQKADESDREEEIFNNSAAAWTVRREGVEP